MGEASTKIESRREPHTMDEREVSARIERLLARPPVEYDFKLWQRPAERAALIQSLSPRAAAAVAGILVRVILGDLGEEPEGADRELVYLMSAQDEPARAGDEPRWGHSTRAVSNDWYLRVYEDELGALYDFCGWPGDCRLGGGVYAPAGVGGAIEIFEYGDGGLDAASESLSAVVELYERLRFSDLDPPGDRQGDPESDD
jgi:hypothetical protein